MGKNILVLEGSPRMDGNSDMLAEAFAEGAGGQGHEVSIIKVSCYRVNGCFACSMCWNMGKPCVQSDDMEKIYPEIEQADAVVWVSPLYFFTWSTQLKAIIDRLYPYYLDRSPVKLKGKESALILAAATDQMAELKGIQETYRIMTEYLGWKNRGEMYACDVWEKGEVRHTDYLERARSLGASF